LGQRGHVSRPWHHSCSPRTTAAGDPFKSILDDGARDDFVLPGSGPAAGASTGSGSGGDGVMTGAARLARAFRTQDADNLLTILGNASLAPELRRWECNGCCAWIATFRIRSASWRGTSRRADAVSENNTIRTALITAVTCLQVCC
jgi:hypothetical protein